MIYIGVDDCSYNPSSTNISLGDTVVWLWQATTNRTISSTVVPPGANSFNSLIDASNPSFMYVFNVAGDYYYKSNILPTCVAHINVSSLVGIKTNYSKFNSKIYPNPVKDVLHLIYPHGAVYIQFYNQKGDLVKDFDLDITQTNANVTISELSSGLYIYSLLDKNKQVMTKSKFIKIQ